MNVLNGIKNFSDLCTGCRSCEIACSFHHNKTFSRNNSSIRIKRNERKGEFEIIINYGKIEELLICDMCADEETPLCVKFCAPKAIVWE